MRTFIQGIQKISTSQLILCGLLLLTSPTAFSLVELPENAPAPTFSEKDALGKTHSLTEYKSKGKWVVLEWYNKDCPYVKKHYGSKHMQGLQTKYKAKGVIWLSVISSAKGKQGYLTPDEAIKNKETSGSDQTAILLDADGSMGKAYGAKTTPHIFVIDPKGNIAYAGAIDNKDSADPKTIGGSKDYVNYLSTALDAGMGGTAIAKKITPPYGCGVKYE